MILDPFTSWFLGLIPVSPFWILYIGTILAFVGLVLYRTDRTITLGLVATVVKSLTDKQGKGYRITIDPGLAREAGAILLIIGLVVATPAVDALSSSGFGSTIINNIGGGPSIYHCPDAFNIACWAGSSSGACTFQSTSCPQMYNQTGTDSISITGSFVGTKTETFATPFPTAPTHYGVSVYDYSGSQGIQYQVANDIALYDALSVYQPIAESFDTSVLATDVGSNVYTVAVTPSTSNEFGVLIIADGLAACPNPGPYTVTDDQGDLWSQVTSNCDSQNTNALAIWTAKLGAAVTTTLTVSGGASSQFGGVVSLYKGVIAAGSSCHHAATALSDSCSITTKNPNEILVGGSALDIFASGTVDTITAGAGQTQRQNDNTNAAGFLVVNYDLEDESVALAGSATYASSYSKADGDVIAAVELIPETLPRWSLSSSYTDVYNTNVFDVTYPLTLFSTPVLTADFYCTTISSPGVSIIVGFFNNGVQIGSLGPINGALLCNGTQRSIAVVPSAGGNGPYTIKMKCSAACPNTYIIVPKIYIVYTYFLVYLPTVFICNGNCESGSSTGPTKTSLTVEVQVVQSYPAGQTLTINFLWWASYP